MHKTTFLIVTGVIALGLIGLVEYALRVLPCIRTATPTVPHPTNSLNQRSCDQTQILVGRQYLNHSVVGHLQSSMGCTNSTNNCARIINSTDGAIAPQRTQHPPYAYKERKSYAKPGLGPVSFHHLDARTVTPMLGEDSVPLSSDSLEQVTASPSQATPAALVIEGLEDDKSRFSSHHAPYAASTTPMFAPAYLLFELFARPGARDPRMIPPAIYMWILM